MEISKIKTNNAFGMGWNRKMGQINTDLVDKINLLSERNQGKCRIHTRHMDKFDKHDIDFDQDFLSSIIVAKSKDKSMPDIVVQERLFDLSVLPMLKRADKKLTSLYKKAGIEVK